MRIRKHASKILGSASCQAWLSSPAPCVDDPAPPHGELCELNQSPWDVLPSPQLPDFHLSDRPHLKIKQDDDDEEEEEDDDDDDDDNNDNDRIILSVLPRMKKKKKKKKKSMIKKNKKEFKKRESNDMCNKSDGKGWRCKKPVQPPHTLCHYHLAQLRSYNAAYRAPSSAGAVANQRRKPGIGSLIDNNGGDFYYYYSGFGPWRGKRRSGGKVVDDDEDDDEDDKDYNEEEEDNGVKGVEIDSLEGDGSDDDDEEEEEEDELEEKKRKSSLVCRKRGRRRIKARSLKSLL
ncbi:nucleolin-like [Dioscorea cayenensis subsp. rotundata]|uniref:Nucleolin-like n=1 Tax=Dioscorea cayennensis subsp. rotundata TaxID=55577 RepID=A0AB40C2T6_DIOCR|nr:nucleolin-like [Dioscorea cayenensis subsp. rotundata]